MSITPAQIDLNLLTPLAYDYETAAKTFLKDYSKFMSFFGLRHGSHTFRMKIAGELKTAGIAVTEFGHSIGLLLSEEDQNALTGLTMEASHFPFLDGYDIHPVMKKEILYLKLKTFKDTYRVKADIVMDYTQPEKSSLSRGDLLEVEVEVKGYLNLKEKKAGFMLDLLRLKTDISQPVKKPRFSFGFTTSQDRQTTTS